MIPYRGKRLAEGIEYVLYKCQKYQGEFTLRFSGSRLFCTSCGNAVTMNKYQLFVPEREDSVYFDGIDRWFDYQKECLEKEIENPGFQMNPC